MSGRDLLLFVAYGLTCFMKFFERYTVCLEHVRINEAVDSTINQISSSCAEWWSPFICRSHVALFSKGFGMFDFVNILG